MICIVSITSWYWWSQPELIAGGMFLQHCLTSLCIKSYNKHIPDMISYEFMCHHIQSYVTKKRFYNAETLVWMLNWMQLVSKFICILCSFIIALCKIFSFYSLQPNHLSKICKFGRGTDRRGTYYHQGDMHKHAQMPKRQLSISQNLLLLSYIVSYLN